MKYVSTLRALLLASLLGLGAMTAAHAQTEPTQYPLLSKAPNVPPNLMLILDDSNSMDYVYMYQDRTDWKWGQPAAEVSGDKRPKLDTYARCSPEVNRIAYNPANLYLPPRNADGTYRAPGSIAAAKAAPPCLDDLNTNPRIYTYKNSGTFYDVANYTFTNIRPARTSYPKSVKRTDCKGTTCTYDEEIQNYANWYSYHRRRIYMATTVLSQVIADAPDTLRLGWARMNHLATTGTIAANAYPLGALDSKPRQNFSKWLDSLTPESTSQGTPSNGAVDRIGKYFMRSDSDGPWGTDPLEGPTTYQRPGTIVSQEPEKSHASCRRSYAMLVTDGYYTDLPTIANIDGTAGMPISATNGSVYTYSPVAPYKDVHSNSMADLAMKYWGTDLRDLNNNVSPIKGTPGDPAFWQHMNFMAVTLGMEGTIAQNATNTTALYNGSLQWPAPAVNTTASIDDIWHATINGRGDFINAGDGDELAKAFNSLVTGILRAAATQGGVAVSAVSLVAGTKKFIPVYTSGQWSGNLIATELDATTGREIKTLWQVETANSNGDEVANMLGSPALRKIFVGTLPDASTKAVRFQYTPMMNNGLLSVMATGTSTPADLINYLRGDRTGEQSDNPPYRKRAFLLGDIVNSNPTIVGPAIDYGYKNLPTIGSTYPAYLDAKSKRDGLVFIGANDGMLHAFSEKDGAEVFAYVPHAVLPSIHQLADKNYVHRYFVDGPTNQGDYHNGTQWKTALVATAGAGAKSVFAIDATTNTLAASSVLWEAHAGMKAYEELGNVLSDVQVGRMMDGTWAAIFGNGYYSKSGKAQLFIVNLQTGAPIKLIDTDAGGTNGLGGVHLVRNASKQVIGAYAGDLKGNLWKFDLSSTSAASWDVSKDGAGEKKPLFMAQTSTGALQPITAAPMTVPHPDGGLMVVLGTGRFFDAADVGTTAAQTVYGVRDANAFAAKAVTSVTGTSTLVMQTIIEKKDVSRVVTAFDDTTSTQVVTYYEVSVNPIDWKTKNGWYFHQPFSGQRVVYPVSQIANRLVKVDTIVPSDKTSDDPCAASTPGAGYNYIIDAVSGGSPQGPFLDTNGDGVVDSSDTSASGYSTQLDGRDQVRMIGNDDAKLVILDSTGGSTRFDIRRQPDGGGGGGGGGGTVKKRSWQQLFLR